MNRNEAITEVLRLDGERTQGEFVLDENGSHPGDVYLKGKGREHWVARFFADKKYAPEDGKKYYPDALHGAVAKAAATKQIRSNAQFFVAAPTMARIIRDQQAQIELLTHALKEAIWLREHIMGSKKRINWGDTFDVDFGHMNEAFITFDRTLARIESGEWMEGGE